MEEGTHKRMRENDISRCVLRQFYPAYFLALSTNQQDRDIPSAISSKLPSSSSSTTIVRLFLSILTTSAASPLNRLKRNLRMASFVVGGRSTEFVDWREV
jgi:hypothetical protein